MTYALNQHANRTYCTYTEYPVIRLLPQSDLHDSLYGLLNILDELFKLRPVAFVGNY
jgi:hypothetical protein